MGWFVAVVLCLNNKSSIEWKKNMETVNDLFCMFQITMANKIVVCTNSPSCVSVWNCCPGTKSNANVHQMHRWGTVDADPRCDLIYFDIVRWYDAQALFLRYLPNARIKCNYKNTLIPIVYKFVVSTRLWQLIRLIVLNVC